jgi:hypothetical protein
VQIGPQDLALDLSCHVQQVVVRFSKDDETIQQFPPGLLNS